MMACLKSRVLTLLSFVLLTLAPAPSLAQGVSPAVRSPSLLDASSSHNETIRPHAVRSLSRQEIFQAIQDDLARLGVPARAELRPADLSIQSSIPVLRDDFGLQVKGIRFDPLRRVTVFELWTSRQPQYLPFEVTTNRDPQSWGLSPELARQLAGPGTSSRRGSPSIAQSQVGIRPKPVVLAKPGTPARLIMLGENVRITTTVIPLQPGAKGQSILVRDLDSARVMTAEVVDQNLLQMRF